MGEESCVQSHHRHPKWINPSHNHNHKKLATTKATTNSLETLVFPKTCHNNNDTRNPHLPKCIFYLPKTYGRFRKPDGLFKPIHRNPNSIFHFNFHLFVGRCFFHFWSKIGRRNKKLGSVFDDPDAPFFPL